MDRDEVLERLDRMASFWAEADMREGLGRGPYTMALRAAAELIRQSGWRPIAKAPEDGQWLFVGKRALKEWYSATMRKSWAIANGYTHYLPEPEPPAREGERG